MRLDKKRIENLEGFIQNMIERQVIPGAVIGIFTKDKALYRNAYGMAHAKKGIPMTEDTIFDLASLTKVCATLPAILILMEKGELDLNDRIERFLPEFADNPITIKHLLTHTSGLPATLDFSTKKYSLKEAVKEIAHFPTSHQPGEAVIYSDLNYILLGYIVEVLTSSSLAEFTTLHIYKPLNMKDTCFTPVTHNRERFAATEFREELGDYQWGVVHDENATAFQGVSGHAGLFSTLTDLSHYAQCLLNLGSHHGIEIMSPATINATIKDYTSDIGARRGLGWQLVDKESSPIGHIFPQDSFGHTGFTGTSLWINNRLNIAVILLTNRVHYGRQTDIIRFRKIVHSLIAMALQK